MYRFKDDYSEGCHPNILEALAKANLVQTEGYGDDIYTQKAIEIIRKKIENPNAFIHFVSGGTQANLIVIGSMLKPYESVISAKTGHINIHEAGAVENTGHKINEIVTSNGKITPQQIKEVLDMHTDEHMVKPRLVFISNSTEIGTIYTKSELEEISNFCKSNDLYLYMDGARIGSALTSVDNDLTLADIARLTDIFYIGGTKNGALAAEAIVINNPEFNTNFRFYLKQKGALLAKGRLAGIQFGELFKDDLFFDLALYANKMADKLRKGIMQNGFSFLTQSSTNQIFPIFPNKLIEKLNKKYNFYVWTSIDDTHSAARLVTSWATKQEAVDDFIKDIQSYT